MLIRILRHPIAFILYLWIELTILIWLAASLTMNKDHGIEVFGVYWHTPIVLIWFAVVLFTVVVIIMTIELIKECTKREKLR